MEKAPVVSKEAAASSSEEKQQGNLGGLIQMYGKVAMLSHVSIQVVFLGIIYTALNGIGVSTVLETLPDGIKSLIDPSAGTLAISFILVKLTMPVRLALDAAVVPTLANALKDTPLSGPLGLNKVEESDA